MVILLLPLVAQSQWREDFSDGDFTSDPTWVGNTADFMVTPGNTLQSNNSVNNSQFYLSTPSTLATVAQWEFFLSLTFNTSSVNYADVYLTASASDLSAATTSGYFLRIGNTTDEISLYRKEATGSITKIIDGVDGITNNNNNTLKIKVTRDAASQWVLFRDITGTGNAYVKEGGVTDATLTTSAYFGILIQQSTATFFRRHYLDDISVQSYTPDLTPPVIQSITVTNANTIAVLFNEALDTVTSQPVTNYFVDKGVGNPVAVLPDPLQPALVRLSFAVSFTGGTPYQLTINGVKDLSGNSLANGVAGFTYIAPYVAKAFDVVLHELMADPLPTVGLPNHEWIELRNTSNRPVNLKNWRIADVSGQSGPFPERLLLPDSFVIVCAASAVGAMAMYGRALPVSNFPSLDNNSDQLWLTSAEGRLIHAVSYTNEWYRNALKKDGGWSLEMVDARNPCSESNNWKASTDSRGGTPGKTNAVTAHNPDNIAPRLLHAYTTDSINIELVFDEPLDSSIAATPARFTISNGIGQPVAATPVPPLFNRIALRLGNALTRNQVYTVTTSGVTDCTGNTIGNQRTARVGLAATAAMADIVINEILFNPPPEGSDYVELYNNSNKIIDLRQTYISNRNSSGAISNITPISATPRLLFPQDFCVITENTDWLSAVYILQNREAIATVPSLPSFNDDKGAVLLLNAQGEITDELNYTDKWHFKLIDNKEGIALERIGYSTATQRPDNWHSAASSAGYGTPGYKNSQYRVNEMVQGTISVSPEIVSPDNDGQDDIATIRYTFPEAGYVANITIFDATGRPVRFLQRNALCGTSGSFNWDGLGEKQQRLATGVYVVFTEVFNLKGMRKQFKLPLVIARRN